jgi:hypothetical protein
MIVVHSVGFKDFMWLALGRHGHIRQQGAQMGVETTQFVPTNSVYKVRA